MSRNRFIVEAEWSGYTSAQRRVVHRTVETLFRAGWNNLHYHSFSDGTGLSISVRDAKPRERVQQIHGYDSLLREAAWRKWEEVKGSAAQNAAQSDRDSK